MMSDTNMNDMSWEEQKRLEQMVAEALMRDKCEMPNADEEWQKVSARLSWGAKSSFSESPIVDGEPAQHFSMRALWTVVGTVAATALIVVLLNIKGLQADNASIYQAKAKPADIVVLDEQENERIVKGNELTLAAASQVEQHTVVVPEGKDMKMTLSDGTEVWLNANSRLTYPTAFVGKERKVTLQGEAYFKVAHDARHPFIVKAGEMQTRVLGTEFNVDASDSERPHVTLVEGRVKVSSSSYNKVLAPGEDAVVNAQGEIKVSLVDTNDVACWKDGIQLFEDAPLRDILLQMGSWYNVSVVCHDDALLNTHFRYMYDRRRGLEEAVKLLNHISNNKIKLHNHTILIE